MSQILQKKQEQNSEKTVIACDVVDIMSPLRNLAIAAKEKAKENELYFSDDMRLTAYFCLSTILRVLNGNPRQLDENDKAIIAYLKQAGCDSNEIAFGVNRSKGAVIAYLKELE
jgi:hypothetical protein